jgi:hypothetical protein
LANVQAKRCTYVADGAEGGHIALQRNGVRRAAMERGRLLGNTLGRLGIFTGTEYADGVHRSYRLIVTLVNFDKD